MWEESCVFQYERTLCKVDEFDGGGGGKVSQEGGAAVLLTAYLVMLRSGPPNTYSQHLLCTPTGIGLDLLHPAAFGSHDYSIHSSRRSRSGYHNCSRSCPQYLLLAVLVPRNK